PALPVQPRASGSARMRSASANEVYPCAMSAALVVDAGSYVVRVSLSGVKMRLSMNAPNGSPLTFSITRPSMRKPVLLYEYRDRGSKWRGRGALSELIRGGGVASLY